MLKMGFLFPLLFLCFLGLADAGQESIAVSVSNEELHKVSSSVLNAETWLRTSVLAHYPANKITTIIIGNSVLCKRNKEHNLGLLIPSVNNMFHSLTRWGLEKDIKVSVAFSNDCLLSHSVVHRDDLAEKIVKPLLEFIKNTNSSITVDLLEDVPHTSAETVRLVSSLLESVKKIGFSEISKVSVMVLEQKQRKAIRRKLSFIDDFKFVDPFPQRPSPAPETAQSPLGSSHAPLSRTASPPPFSLPFVPESPVPASPPFGFTLPPCNPGNVGAPVPEIGVLHRLWCVAKPSVPEETLQEAMNYACGEGGGDCEEIMPQGNCYYPDTVVAHASYAFNSYWQKNKRNGGTCSFGGTAMIINADPSFLHCRFVLN